MNFEFKNTYKERWLDHFRRHAESAAEMSKDATKIGAALIGPDKEVLLTAFNGPGLGVKDTPERRNKRPLKYHFACHAEQNLVAFAARNGISLKGKSVYTTHFPCANCANTLIQAGISAVIVKNGSSGNTTMIDDESYKCASESFIEAGVRVFSHDIKDDIEYAKMRVKNKLRKSSIIGRGLDFDHLNTFSYQVLPIHLLDFWTKMEERFLQDADNLRYVVLENKIVEGAHDVADAWMVAAMFSEDVLYQMDFKDVTEMQPIASRAFKLVDDVHSKWRRNGGLTVNPVVRIKYSFPVW